MLRCSFCGKKQNEVKKLITGTGVSICDECVKICTNILTEKKKEQPKPVKQFDYRNLLKPKLSQGEKSLAKSLLNL